MSSLSAKAWFSATLEAVYHDVSPSPLFLTFPICEMFLYVQHHCHFPTKFILCLSNCLMRTLMLETVGVVIAITYTWMESLLQCGFSVEGGGTLTLGKHRFQGSRC